MNDYAFETNLARNEANHVAPSPLGVIARTADIYPERCVTVAAAFFTLMISNASIAGSTAGSDRADSR